MSFTFNTSVVNHESVKRQGKDKFLGCLNKVRCKYSYVRIPKTGSASLNRSLYNATNEAKVIRQSDPSLKNALLQAPDGWWDHWSASWCRDIVGHDAWNNIFSFSVVRNPYARLYSLWNSGEPSIRQKYSFQHWILEGCPSPWNSAMSIETHPPNPVLSQNSWICDDGKNIVDFVFRLEDINTVGIDVLGNLLGKDRFYIHSNRMNQSAEDGEYKKHYTPRLIDRVSQLCAEDLQAFKYNFEGTTQDNWFYLSE